MKSIFKLVAIFALACSALGASTSTAWAAAPANDTFAGATVVAVGYSETIDTSEATTDADDAQLNTNCGAPATDASVWYAINGTDTTVIVDVSQSGYSAGVLVGVGTQGNLSIVNCGPGAVGFFALAGETYYVLAIDDQLNGDGLNGGSLTISFSEILAPVLDEFTVDRFGSANTRTGVATISGTYACSHADFIEVDVRIAITQSDTGAASFMQLPTALCWLSSRSETRICRSSGYLRLPRSCTTCSAYPKAHSSAPHAKEKLTVIVLPPANLPF